MSTQASKTIESAYFHTGNSGITIEMTEITDQPDSLSYRLNVAHGAHGAHTSVSIPLGSDHMVDYLIEALGRLRGHMQDRGFDCEHAFDYARRGNASAYATVKNGLSRRDVRKEFVSSEWGTESRLVAIDWLDGEKRLVRREAVSDEDQIAYGIMGEECCDTEMTPRFKAEEIGCEVRNGVVFRG